MGFFKTLFTGYRLMYQDLTTKHPDLLPRAFSGCGTGLMMIGSAVMAKTGLKDDTKDIIAECDAVIAEAEKHIEGEKKPARVKRIFKAKVIKGWKVVKVFHKGIIYETVGAACVGTGLGISEHGKHRAIKAAAAIGTSFAAYRANVRDDLGEDADLVEHEEKQVDGFGSDSAPFAPKVNGRKFPSAFLPHAAHPVLAGLSACHAVYQFLATLGDGCLPFYGRGGFKHIAYQGHGGTIRGQQTMAE